MSPKYNSYQLSKIEEETVQITSTVVKDAQNLLMQVRERSATMSDQNKRSAAEYVAGIRNALKERTNMGVQQANKIVLDKIRDVENELTSFSLVIDDAVSSFVEDADFDINNIQSKVSKAESGDAAQVLETAMRQVEEEIRAMLNDVDQMFSFYGRYIGNIVERSMQNATDRISMMLNAQRRSCDCSVIDRINMCYNISSQNGEVSKNLMSVIKMVNVVQNTTDTVKGLEYIYADVDKRSHSLFEESRHSLQKITDDCRHTMDAIMENDNCFLGSMVRRLAYEDHATLKEFMIRSMKTVIQSLARNLHSTMDTFEVVKPVEHRNRLVIEVEEKLEKLVNEMKSKALLVADATQRVELENKANLGEVKDLLKTKFANVTNVVNNFFNENRDRLSNNLKYNLGYIAGQQLPYISTMTIQNYIPSDVCPLSVDYQKFISTTMKNVIDKSDSDIINDLFDSANYFGDDTETGAARASSNDMVSLVPTDSGSASITRVGDNIDEGTDEGTSMFTNLMQSIIAAINNAGYTVENPVRIVVTDDKK